MKKCQKDMLGDADKVSSKGQKNLVIESRLVKWLVKGVDCHLASIPTDWNGLQYFL